MAQRYILEADWGIAVKKINPNSNFTGTLEDITWQEGTTPISREDIQAKIDEMNVELDNNKYQRDRATAYPSIQEQLDMQYWDKVNGTTNWEDSITQIKTDNPKN